MTGTSAKRARKQKEVDIRVIVGNPPYSAQQDSENDDNRNLKYPKLDTRIGATYAHRSSAVLKKNLYDSYIRAIRWATDRIQDKGIICFVTNGSFIDETNLDGIRKTLLDEFCRAYVFNLRGNQRTQGEQSRKEGGKIFGSGSRASVAITLLVKDEGRTRDHTILYHDVGDYLTRDEKLNALRDSGSVANLPWQRIIPNDHGDWINLRDPTFAKFIPLGDKKNSEAALFDFYSLGVVTNRDPWVYNFSRRRAESVVHQMIDFFNDQVRSYEKARRGARQKAPDVNDVIERNPKKLSWTRNLKDDVRKLKSIRYDQSAFVTSQYRPFTKQHLYFNRRLNEMVNRTMSMFPASEYGNIVISVTGVADRKGFSVLIADHVPNMHLTDTGQCFPLYFYEETPRGDLLDRGGAEAFVRRDAISDFGLNTFRKIYADQRGAKIGKEDLFYYVYGILHSPEYKTRFEADLRKQLPRIPCADDFWAFSEAGRALALWHLNYETVEPYPLQHAGELDLGDAALYRVQKMAWAKKRVDGKLVEDKTTLIYNSRLTLTGIPPEALEYVVNGKPALEWVMERYKVTTDKASGIVNDPNDWTAEHDDPAYVFNLVKRAVRVGVETMRIVTALPALQEKTSI